MRSTRMLVFAVYILLSCTLSGCKTISKADTCNAINQLESMARLARQDIIRPDRIDGGAKNIVLCLDGTNNTISPDGVTNIIRIYSALQKDCPSTQVVYYGPGVGSYAPYESATIAGSAGNQVFGQAFGKGIIKDAIDSIEFLSRHYEGGDRVYIFGFSRGAYTARLVAAILHHGGIPRKNESHLAPFFVASLIEGRLKDPEYALSFRQHFGQVCPVWFLGLYDTVITDYDEGQALFTTQNPNVEVVRHAVSLDERRAFFELTRWNERGPGNDFDQDVVEVFLPGVHSDIGGGYDFSVHPMGALSFRWMLEEAQSNGIQLKLPNKDYLEDFYKYIPDTNKQWECMQLAQSLTVQWFWAEFFPRRYSKNWYQMGWPSFNFFGRRHIYPGELLHNSVLMKIRADETYRPDNLSKKFISAVLAGEVPLDQEVVEYWEDRPGLASGCQVNRN